MVSSNNPLISVIVPVYKVEQYINKCVNSIIVQTYKNLEIILVDDGSPDRCPLICDEWSKKDSRISVIHKTNGGLSSARNAGTRLAKGQYISYIDSDDTIMPSFYEELLYGFANFPDVGISAVCVLKEDGETLSDYNDKWICDHSFLVSGDTFSLKMLSQECCYTAWNKLYLAELCKTVFFVEGRNNEDTMFMYQLGNVLSEKGLSMVQLPYKGYVYNMRQDSICHSIKVPLSIDVIKNLDDILNDCDKNSQLHNCASRLRLNSLLGFLEKMMSVPQWKSLYYEDYRQQLSRNTLQQVWKILGWKSAFLFFLHTYCPKMRSIIFTLWR